MATISGKDRNRARTLVTRFDEVDRTIASIAIPDVDLLTSRTKKLRESISTRVILGSIDIRVLAPFGYDVASLAEQGMFSLLDVLRGDDGHEYLSVAVLDVYEAISHAAWFALDATARPSEETALLRAVRQCVRIPAISADFENLRRGVERLRSSCEVLRDLPGYLTGLFLPGARHVEIVSAIEALEMGIDDLEMRATSVEARLRTMREMGDGELWDNYASDVDEFSRTLDSVTGVSEGERLPVPSDDILLRAADLLDRQRKAKGRAAAIQVPDEKRTRQDIVRYAHEVRDRRVRSLLADVGVEALALESPNDAERARGHKITSALQVLDLDIEELRASVGERAAQVLSDHADEAYRYLMARTGAGPNVAEKSPEQDALVRALVTYARLPLTRAEKDSCVKVADEILDRLGEAIGTTDLTAALFMDADDRIHTTTRLSSIDQEFRFLEARMERLELTCDLGSDEAWRAYERNVDRHLRILESIAKPEPTDVHATNTSGIALRAHALIGLANAIEAMGRKITVPDEDEAHVRLVRAADDVRRHRVRSQLSSCRLSVLAPYGIEVERIPAHDAMSVYDLLASEVRSGGTCYSDEIERARAIATHMYESLYDRTPCVIDNVRRPPQHTELIRALVALDRLGDVRKTCQSLSDALDEAVTFREHLSSRLVFPDVVFMPSETGKHFGYLLDHAKTVLSDLNDNLSRAIACQSEISVSEAWSYYEERRAHFDALIAALNVGDTHEGCVLVADLADGMRRVRSMALDLEAHVKGLKVPKPDELTLSVRRRAEHIVAKDADDLIAGLDVGELAHVGANEDVVFGLSPMDVGSLAALDPDEFFAEVGQSATGIVGAVSRLREVALSLMPCVIDDTAQPDTHRRLVQEALLLDGLAHTHVLKNEVGDACDEITQSCDRALKRFDDPAMLFMDTAEGEALERELRVRETELDQAQAAAAELLHAIEPTDDEVFSRYRANKERVDALIAEIAHTPRTQRRPVIAIKHAHMTARALEGIREVADKVSVSGLPTSEEQRGEIFELALAVREDHILELLQQVRTADLDNEEVNGVALEEAGYANARELWEAGADGLASTLGEHEGAKTWSLVHKAHEELETRVPCLIDAYETNGTQADLVRSAIRLDRLTAARQTYDTLRDDAAALADKVSGLTQVDYASRLIMAPDAVTCERDQIEGLTRRTRDLNRRHESLRSQMLMDGRGGAHDVAWQVYDADRDRYDELIANICSLPTEMTLPDITAGLAHDVYRALRRLYDLEDNLESVRIPTILEQMQRIKDQADRAREQQVQTLLRRLSVEVLEPTGVDAERLIQSGIKNLAQLLRAINPETLFSKKEAVTLTAAAVCCVVHDSVLRRTCCDIDPKKRLVRHTGLVRDLTLLIRLSDVAEKRNALATEISRLVNYKALLSPEANYPTNLFMSSMRRERFEQAHKRLTQMLPILEERFDDLQRDLFFTNNEAWETYAKKPGFFDEIVDEACQTRTRGQTLTANIELAREALDTFEKAQAIVERAVRLEPPTDEMQVADIRERIVGMRNHTIDSLLERTSVDVLSPLEIDASILRALKITNLRQLRDHDTGKLKRDVGEGQFDLVTKYLPKILTSLHDQVGVVIDTSDVYGESAGILEATCLYFRLDAIHTAYDRLFDDLAACVHEREILVEKDGYPGDLYVLPDRKVHVRRAVDVLTASFDGFNAQLEDLESLLTIGHMTARDFFVAHRADVEDLILSSSDIRPVGEVSTPTSDLARRARDTIERFDHVELEIAESIPESEDKQRKTVRYLASQVIEADVDRLLEELDVSALGPLGIDVHVCHLSGLTSVADALTQADGKRGKKLSKASMKRLTRAAESVREACRSQVPCLIDERRRSDAETELICALIALKELPTVVRLRSDLMKRLEDLSGERKLLGNEDDYATNLFMCAERRSAFTAALETLDTELDDLEAKARLLASLCQGAQSTRTKDESWSLYLKERDHYDEIVRLVTGSAAGGELPIPTPELALDAAWALSEVRSMKRMFEGLPELDEARLRTNVSEDIKEVRHHYLDDILSCLPIETLETLDVDTGFAPQIGCYTLAQLLAIKPHDDHARVQEWAVAQATAVALRIRDNAMRSVPCLLRLEMRDETQARLVRNVVLLESLPAIRSRKEAVAWTLGEIDADVLSLEPETPYQANLFMASDRRDAFARSLDSLMRRLPDLASKTLDLRYDLTYPGEYAWAAYEKGHDAYDALIRQVSGAPAHAELPQATPELAQAAFDLSERLAQVRDALGRIDIGDPETLDDEIKEAIEDVRLEETDRYLEGMNVAVLSHVNVNVKKLRDAGLTTLLDLRGLDEEDLTLGVGLSKADAREVVRMVRNIYASAYDSARIVPDAVRKPESHTRLLRLVYRFRVLRHLRQLEEDLLNKGVSMSSDYARLRGQDAYLSNLVLTGKRHSEYQRLVSRFALELPALEADIDDLLERAREATSTSVGDVWVDYHLHVADYHAIISERGAGVGALAYGDLPERLVDRIEQIPLYEGMLREVTLRNYQRFAAKYTIYQRRVLIGDEMGLGKTIEALAVMSHLFEQGERLFVVVCPLSVLMNWENEVKKHSKLRPKVIYGPYRDKEFKLWCLHGGVAITTHDLVRKLDWPWLKNRIGLIVIDEAHSIKNPRAQRTKAITESLLPLSDRTLFLTGTPLENNLGEMEQLLSYLDKGLIDGITADTRSNPPEYRKTISPVYLRRKRDDVLMELPKLTVKDDYCRLTRADDADYRHALEDGSFSGMRRVGWRHEKMANSAKAERLLEICREARANGSKVLIFSFFLDTLAKVEELLGDNCAGVISGKISARRRFKLTDEFKSSDKDVLVAQVIAGGVGLNIQAANVIIFCEPQVKPSIEEQAISRSFRMGQDRPVVVHRLLMSGTVDERVETILEKKRREFNDYADISHMGQESLDIIDTTAILKIIEEERNAHKVKAKSAPDTRSIETDGVIDA